MKNKLKKLLRSLGYNISKIKQHTNVVIEPEIISTTHIDMSEEVLNIFQECNPYTMISLERVEAIINSIDYICKNNIEGDIVECGVWRGGAMFAAAKALLNRNVVNKKFFLFDTYDTNTFGSTTNETIFDKDYSGKTALDAIKDGSFVRENYTYQLDEVKNLLKKTGYPEDNFICVVGRVQQTIPFHDVNNLCLLRLDTDWYESTKHELVNLYPKLVKGGVLLIDDYGYWVGCKQAVEEYISETGIQILLHRDDFTGRSAVKQ